MERDALRSERIVTFLTQRERDDLFAISQRRDKSVSAICHQFISDAISRLNTQKDN